MKTPWHLACDVALPSFFFIFFLPRCFLKMKYHLQNYTQRNERFGTLNSCIITAKICTYSVFLQTLACTRISWETCLKWRFLGSNPRELDSKHLGWGQMSAFFSKHLGVSIAGGPESRLEETHHMPGSSLLKDQPFFTPLLPTQFFFCNFIYYF